MFSSPAAGQPEAHAPQVRHKFRFPFEGRISSTFSMNVFLRWGMIFMALASLMVVPLVNQRIFIAVAPNHREQAGRRFSPPVRFILMETHPTEQPKLSYRQ
jgi:hypothetical protein